MSYTYLRESGEEFLVEHCLDIPAYVQLKLNLTVEQSCCKDKEMEYCQDFRFGTTSEHSTEGLGKDSLTSCVEDSPAKIFQSQEGEGDSMAREADCGKRCGESFAKLDHTTSSWKTRQLCLLEEWEQSLKTWPKWGMMQGGECWELTTSELLTNENEFGLWPTPTASDHLFFCATTMERKERTGVRPSGAKIGSALKWYRPALPYVINGKLDPNLGEWLMGYPINWTDLKPLEMDRYLEWHRFHSKCLALHEEKEK